MTGCNGATGHNRPAIQRARLFDSGSKPGQFLEKSLNAE